MFYCWQQDKQKVAAPARKAEPEHQRDWSEAFCRKHANTLVERMKAAALAELPFKAKEKVVEKKGYMG